MAVMESENERVSKIGVVVNFLDEVRAKLPAAK